MNVVNVQPRYCPFELAETEAKILMVVLSIQVCIGLIVVKDWGLHPIIECSTLEEISSRLQLQSGELEGTCRVLLPETPDNAEYKGH